jgi:histidine triad (HIT) family protein
MTERSIFSKIIAGELPADKVFENEKIIAIKDLYPAAPVHILIISKKEIRDLQSVNDEEFLLVAEMIRVARNLATQYGIANGYRLLTNNGALAGQSIFHLHFHLIGGCKLGPVA